MKKNYTGRGFTLIELLVVIAIIGILASVVLASLNTARDKGSNAAIKGELDSAKKQATLFYDELNQSYDDGGGNSLCTNGSASTPVGIDGIMTSIDAKNGAGSKDCNNDAVTWAAASDLINTTPAQYHCTDSTGFVGTIDGTVGDTGGSNDFADTDLQCQ